jgi:hypothetical protein
MAYWNAGGAAIDRPEEADWNAPFAFPSLVPAFPQDQPDLPPHPRPATPSLPRCPEIDCVRHLLPPSVIAIAELRAAEAGVGADRVLITWGLVSEETYVAALTASLGVEFEPLFNIPREQCPLSEEQLIEAANTGMLPLSDRNGVKIVVVPGLVDSRRLVAVARSGGELASRLRVTSATRLRDFVGRHSAHEIQRRAVDELRSRHRDLSAGVGRPRRKVALAYLALAALTAFAAPSVALAAAELFLGAVFLAWTALRLFGLFSERFMRRQPRTFSDGWLPTYSIVIALYREAAAVPDLVTALRSLNYPGIMAQTPQAV